MVAMSEATNPVTTPPRKSIDEISLLFSLLVLDAEPLYGVREKLRSLALINISAEGHEPAAIRTFCIAARVDEPQRGGASVEEK